MNYLSIEEAKQQTGLRLVLTRGLPGPWSEAAKAILNVRNVDYVAVEQQGGRRNPELVEWTGHRNAPIALFNDEPPRVRWLEILDLAERLGSGPSLIPEDRDDRMLMVGLANEIAGDRGFAWNARLLMLNAGFQAQGQVALEKNPMYSEYQFDAEQVQYQKTNIELFLTDLTTRIRLQNERGSNYLVGSTLTAVDIYWACFSNMLEALPPEKNPMPDGLRSSWAILAKSIHVYDPILIEQRDKTYQNHLSLPLTF
ncbi:MAG: hypothetical protein VB957_14955 [Pseudomonadales bacterium]